MESKLKLEEEKLKAEIAAINTDNIRKTRISVSVITAIIAAIFGLVSSVANHFFQKSREVELEQEKLNSSLILKAIDTESPEKSRSVLNFLLELELIKDKNGVIRDALANSDINIPALRSEYFVNVFVKDYNGKAIAEAEVYLDDISLGTTNLDGELSQGLSTRNIGLREFKVFKDEKECEYKSIEVDKNNKVQIVVKCI